MYEEYMQNFLNYPGYGHQNMYGQDGYTYNPYNYEMQKMFESNCNMGCYNQGQSVNLEGLYPEIYKVLYPMIKKVCMRNNGQLNEEVINKMVDEVYSNIETNEAINLNITINNDIKGDNKAVVENKTGVENRESKKNNILNDLIKILILRELLGRPNRPKTMYNPMANPWQNTAFPQF